MLRQFAGILLFIGMCSMLSGCGTARLIYTKGESLSYWWFNGYLDFEPAQINPVKADIAELFAWHRQTQLPEYALLLTAAENRLRQDVTLADVRSEIATIKKFVPPMTERAAPALARLARSLTPDQLDFLKQKLASKNADYRKEFLRGSAEDRQRRRSKKVLQQAEYWFGGFTSQQEAQIRMASDARPLDPEFVYADRLERQAALLSLIQKIKEERLETEPASKLITAFLDTERHRQAVPEKKAYFDAASDANARLVTTIINIATPMQRDKAIERLRRWIADLDKLARK
ncbi:MAG: DUF6279 family lipoprotein [Pseudomonadota bacterium]